MVGEGGGGGETSVECAREVSVHKKWGIDSPKRVGAQDTPRFEVALLRGGANTLQIIQNLEGIIPISQCNKMPKNTQLQKHDYV